jgi:hypothetical protein
VPLIGRRPTWACVPGWKAGVIPGRGSRASVALRGRRFWQAGPGGQRKQRRWQVGRRGSADARAEGGDRLVRGTARAWALATRGRADVRRGSRPGSGLTGLGERERGGAGPLGLREAAGWAVRGRWERAGLRRTGPRERKWATGVSWPAWREKEGLGFGLALRFGLGLAFPFLFLFSGFLSPI